MNWQPIETAPKDETEFLAHDVLTGKCDVCKMTSVTRRDGTIVWWPEAVQSDGEYGPFTGEFGHDDKGIQFWQPLPSPPPAIRKED